MEIERATIVHNAAGSDTVLLFTNLPSSMPKVTDQNLIIKFDCAANTAEEYLKANFPNVTKINTMGVCKM